MHSQATVTHTNTARLTTSTTLHVIPRPLRIILPPINWLRGCCHRTIARGLTSGSSRRLRLGRTRGGGGTPEESHAARWCCCLERLLCRAECATGDDGGRDEAAIRFLQYSSVKMTLTAHHDRQTCD